MHKHNNIYNMSGFMKTVLKMKSRVKRAFSSRQKLVSKGDDMKIKRRGSTYSLPVHPFIFLSSLVVLSLFFAFCMAWRRPKRVMKSR